MKKVIALMLSLIITLSMFTGCSGAANTDTTDYSSMTIDELKPLIKTISEGKLTMVTSPDFAPYEFYSLDEDGTPTLAGFDIALGYYIADYLDLELEIIPMDFDGTISELSFGKADIGMAGYSPDPKRENAMLFSDIYYSGSQAFVTLQENADLFQTLEDTNNAQYKIGAQIGSIQAQLAKSNSSDADIVELSKVTDIIAEVISGKLHGAYVETVVAEAYMKTFPQLYIAMEVPYEQAGNVVGVNKNNPALLAAVNLALKAAIDDGSLARFITEANEAAQSNTFEGLLDSDGSVPEN